MASAKRVSREAYEDLCRLIQHWNENRLELFEISVPNEVLTQVLVHSGTFVLCGGWSSCFSPCVYYHG